MDNKMGIDRAEKRMHLLVQYGTTDQAIDILPYMRVLLRYVNATVPDHDTSDALWWIVRNAEFIFRERGNDAANAFANTLFPYSPTDLSDFENQFSMETYKTGSDFWTRTHPALGPTLEATLEGPGGWL